MDPFTHSLTGLAISHALCSQSNYEGHNKFSFKTFTLAVIAGTVIPDSDIVVSIWGGSTSYFINHRGITHSLLGLLILPLICALAIKFFNKGQPFMRLWIGAIMGMISHILLDVTNVYSTLALWPISDKMVSLNLMPIIDLFVFVVYISAILLVFLKPLKIHRRKIFIASLSILLCYVGVRVYIQNDLTKNISNEYKNGKLLVSTDRLPIDKLSILSNSLNMLSWTFIIDNKVTFIKGEVIYSPFKKATIKSIDKKEKMQMTMALKKAAENPLGKFVLKFSPYVDYAVENYQDGYIVKMIDLRYANLRQMQNSRRSYFFGGYTVLDKNFNTTYWGTSPPSK